MKKQGKKPEKKKTERATAPAMIGEAPAAVRARFGAWFTERYRAWRRERILRDPDLEYTQVDFSAWLDMPTTMVSYYLNGQRVPRQDRIEEIALKLGDDVYEILGYARPDRRKRMVDQAWPSLPDELRAEIERIVIEALRAGLGSAGEGRAENAGSRTNNETGTDASGSGGGSGAASVNNHGATHGRVGGGGGST